MANPISPKPPIAADASRAPSAVRTGEPEEPHLQNLPRPRRPDTTPSGPARPGGSGDRGKLQPVDFESTGRQAAVAEEVDEATSVRGVTGGVVVTPPGKARTEPRPRTSDDITHSRGIARLSGQTLHFPKSVKLSPQDSVFLGSRVFDIKPAKRFTPQFWAMTAGVIVLVILAAEGISTLFSTPPPGSITGVVVDRATGRILPQVSVSVEGGVTVSTSSAGLYSIDHLAPGGYRVTASAPGYEPQSGSVVRPADGNAQLAFALMPLGFGSETSHPTTYDAAPSATPADEENLEAGQIAYGNVTLATDFDGYMVYVDDVIYGKNAKKIKRMPAGTHKIVLQVDGFEDFSTSVDVKARATATVTVAKNDLTPKVDPLGRARAQFAEAKTFLDRGQWTAAIDAYTRGLNDDSKNATALQHRGWAYFKSGNHDNARKDFLAAAQLHQAENNYLDAVACAGNLIDLNPNDPDAYRRRADFYTALREYNKAIGDYEQAVKVDRKSLPLQMGLAEACFIAGEFRRAAKEFEKARKLADDPTDVYVRWLIALTRAGEDNQVRKRFKEFSGIASPERQAQLKTNPEWLRVLQIVDPMQRSEG